MGALIFPYSEIQAASIEKKPEWHTHKDLMRILNFAQKHSCKEKLDFTNPVHWNGSDLPLHEAFYLSLMRLSNIMYRRTLDNISDWWIVVSPQMCQQDIWYSHQFCDWDKENKIWVKWYWKDRSKEVSPGVWKSGKVGSKWQIYIDEKFPSNVVLLGMGYKKVTRFKKTGKIISNTYDNNGNSWTHEYPETEAYLGNPTSYNYSLIRKI